VARGSTEQDLTEVLLDWQSGWFFVRLYDDQDTILDSFDFRFVRPLVAVLVEGASSLPGPAGHGPVRVRFEHRGPCQISPPPEAGAVTVSDESTRATLPAAIDADKSEWKITGGHGTNEFNQAVPVTLLLERLWWAIADELTPGRPAAPTGRRL
jgi:hypothetical protein